MIFLFFSFLQLASFLVGSCAISLSSMLDVPILKYLARLSQSYAMANMYLIVRAWCLDRNYYSPNTGRGYAQKRDSSSADHDRWWTTLAQVTGVLGVRKIPLGKFPQRMFYSVLLLIFFLKYNIVDFPGYDDIVGYCYVPAYGLFLYGLCVVFFENDVNQEEASVYRWAILSLVVGVVLWSDVFHLGGALNNVVNEMIIAWFVTPCTVFAVLLLDERLEKGRDTSKIILTTEEEGAEVEKTCWPALFCNYRMCKSQKVIRSWNPWFSDREYGFDRGEIGRHSCVRRILRLIHSRSFYEMRHPPALCRSLARF